MTRPGLIMLGGLPGTGKSTIAVPLARELHAAYLRIDTIEQAMVESGELAAPPRAAGYTVGYALARDQLGIGITVVVECVNPLKITRDAWKEVGDAYGEWMLEIELICSDRHEHRTRVEQRTVDIPGLKLPAWQQVVDREYEPWDRGHLVIDTSVTSATVGVAVIVNEVNALAASVPPAALRAHWPTGEASGPVRASSISPRCSKIP
jgi:predicted kinase